MVATILTTTVSITTSVVITIAAAEIITIRTVATTIKILTTEGNQEFNNPYKLLVR